MIDAVGRLADTGYLLSFCSVPEGHYLLREIFSEQIGVPPAVRSELRDLKSTPRYDDDVHVAASRMDDSTQVVDVALLWADLPDRDAAQAALSGEILAPHFTDWDDTDAERPPIPPVTVGKHAGESEAIAISVRTSLPLLVNDPGARQYASDLAVVAEPAPVSLARLLGRYSGKQLFEIHKQMEQVTRSKVAVTGHLWFTDVEFAE